MTQVQILQETSVIYFKYLATSLLHRQVYQRRYSALPYQPLSVSPVPPSGCGGIYLITIQVDASIQLSPSSIEQSRSSTKTRPMLGIPAVFLPLSFALLFVVALLSPHAWIMLLAIGNVCWWLFLFLYTL